MVDSSQLLEAASDFAHYTGAHSDDSARDFLNRFPLPVIFSALQTQFDVPGLENTLVTCLERLFNTKLGASLIPQYMPFVQVGLQADSQAVRSLACKTVTCLIENLDNDHKVAASVRLIKDFNMYPLLLDCFIKGKMLPCWGCSSSFLKCPCVKVVISSIDGRLQSLDALDRDECETALESLGHMGSYIQGATLLLSGSSPAARHVIDAAFEGQGPTGHGKQLFTLHALGNISGKTRSENSIILNAEAEVNLRRLIYETASRSTKLTPSGLFLSVLQQDSEMRLAGYRMLSELVARPWCLMEICSKQEIINKVTDPSTETTKIGMEGRYDCCKAIHKSLTVSSRVSANPAFAGIAAKLQEAVEMGPYLIKRHVEAQPAVMTADRF
uniref:26S proteasome non-ATPase regulatory subunit 5 n=1 Tax=Glycine max TaxID=3847 RepID=K7LV61_SOYBN